MSIWEDEFKCWNTDEPALRRDRYCEICGVNKPLELHETWCPNEPDRILKDDLGFWYDNAEGDECGCNDCLTFEQQLTPGTKVTPPHFAIRPVFDPEGVGPEQATADGLNPRPYYVPSSRNPAFDALLEQMRDIHNCKNQDYAEEGNPYSNFEFAAKTAGCSVDTVFRTLIGVKLARLDELLKGKTPKFESIADTRLDLAIYSALWASYAR